MASFTLGPGVFPAGTSVAARKRSNWPASQQDLPTGTPGSADETETTAADGTTAFTALTDNTRYIASGTVDGATRYVQFRTAVAGSETAADVDVTSIAAGSNLIGKVDIGGSATLTHGQLTTDATAAGILLKASNAARKRLVVRNNHASTIIYLGKDSAVTTSTGFPLSPGESFTYEIYTGDVYYRSSAAANDLRYSEVG